ncbi:MAG: YceI family protein [Capnocytophaga sp.]|nr:YceI family protein [Capnocytophaga sp.]
MKKLILVASVLFAAVSFAQNTYHADPAHSRIQFKVSHLTVADVTGNFDKFDLAVQASDVSFADAKLTFSAQVNSINTHVEARDNHLKSADFFDAEKYPTLNFVSTSIKKKGKNKFVVNGNLTLHGVTKPVAVLLENRGTTVNPMNKKSVSGLRVTTVIKRSDFNIGGDFPTAVIGDEVQIQGDFEVGTK